MTDARLPLSAVNLNLFPVLDAMLRHQSVSRSAEELGVTPSAVSHALRELRSLLDDPLFVRSGGVMLPTRRARDVGVALRGGLGLLARVIQPQSVFDPAASARVCTLATSDETLLSLIPATFARLRREAPSMAFNVRPRTVRAMEMLEVGELDLLFQLEQDLPAWAGHTVIDRGEVACLVRADHPAVGETLTPETYSALPHVRVSPQGYGMSTTEQRLHALGIQRRIAVRTYSFVTAAELVARSDAIVTMPERLARVMASRLDLRVMAPPFDVPGFVLDLVWHRGRDDDALAWLRGVLLEVAPTVGMSVDPVAPAGSKRT